MSGPIKSDCLLAFDLEMTCWHGDPPPGERREIIAVGLARMDLATLELSGRQTFLVRPQRSTVSDFCTRLTGLTGPQLQRQGRPLREVLSTVQKKWGPGQRLALTWGDDASWLERECGEGGFESPFRSVIDIQPLVLTMLRLEHRISLEATLQRFGLSEDGPLHDPSIDAQHVLKLWSLLLGRLRGQSVLPPTPVMS